MSLYSAKTFFAVLILLVAASISAKEPEGGRVLDDKLHHIGDSVIDFWPEVSKAAESKTLEARFDAAKNQIEFTLSMLYWDINDPAVVELNGKKIDELAPSQHRKLGYVIIPKGALKDGANIINIIPRTGDDCVIGKLKLYPKPFVELMRLQPVKISVTDADTGKAIPARVTITDSDGDLRQIFFAPTNGAAVRTGTFYTRGTETTVQLSEGNYVFYATRGMEWSRDKQLISVTANNNTDVSLRIRREVNTPGYIAADTHIHTLTFSGHGDATVEERMVTLAGEGVELAVATDHNHQTDYRPFQQKLGLNEFFTPVTGNEVTTHTGHFNGFPLPPGDDVPNHTDTNWVKIVEGIRAKGAKVVILNHPRWPKIDTFELHGLNSLTGDRASGMRFTFDGMELANSGTLVTNVLDLFHEWFALLNWGEKFTAVGASDSHTVAEEVGQGRTYIRSSTDDPTKIDVDEICKSFRAGDTSVSLGIYCEASVNEGFGMGQIMPVENRPVKVQVRVAAPSWIKPRRAMVFLNGFQVGEKAINTPEGKATDQQFEFSVPAPKYDAYIVCVVMGDPVTEPCWATLEPYTVASSNPIYLDADKDGKFQSPRETAKALLGAEMDFEKQWGAISHAEDAIAVQMLSLIHGKADENRRKELTERLEKEAAGRNIYAEFLKSIPPRTAPLPGS